MKNIKLAYLEEENLNIKFWTRLYRFETSLRRFYTVNPLFPFVLILIIVIPVIFILSKNYYYDEKFSGDFYRSLLGEAHGMLFDIFIFGIFITLINIRRNKRLEIKRYKEEIEDYRGWKEPQASYRLGGIIRRLADKGERDLVLFDCHLIDAKLTHLNLHRAVLSFANLKRAHLEATNLIEAHLEGANLENAYMKRSRLDEANFEGANLKGAHLERASLVGAKIDLFQLKEVGSLEDTIMPDGSLYNEDWAKKIRESEIPSK